MKCAHLWKWRILFPVFFLAADIEEGRSPGRKHQWMSFIKQNLTFCLVYCNRWMSSWQYSLDQSLTPWSRDFPSVFLVFLWYVFIKNTVHMSWQTSHAWKLLPCQNDCINYPLQIMSPTKWKLIEVFLVCWCINRSYQGTLPSLSEHE